MEDDEYRTSDMALVTYLKLRFFRPVQISWMDGTCYWWFTREDALLENVDAFMTKDALVEPTEYNRIFSQTKREFYDSKPAQAS